MIPASPTALLATDLDGTLAVDGKIGVAQRLAAARLKSAGIPILVITGRNLLSLSRVDGLWTVADEVLFSSGAGLLSHPKGIPEERSRLPYGEVQAIVDILDGHGEDYCILNPVPDKETIFVVNP